MTRLLAAADLGDLIALVGLVLLGAGLALVSLALALSIVGALLFLYAAVPPLLERPPPR